MLVNHLADHCCVLAERMLPKYVKRSLRGVCRNENQHLAFVGHVDRVHAEKLAGGADLGPHRNVHFLDHHAYLRGCGNLIQRGSGSAARRIAHNVNRRTSRTEYIRNESVQRSRVALDCGLELQTFTDAHDGHAVIADTSAEKYDVPGTGQAWSNIDARWNQADSGGVYVASVAVAFLDDLGVASDNLHSGSARGFGHVVHDPPQGIHGKTFFENHPDAKVERTSARDRKVVDRAVHRQFADASAG